MKKAFIVCTFFLSGILCMSFAEFLQDGKTKKWDVPEAAAGKKNPVKSDAENIAAGKVLYNKHCKSCHGTLGKGDGPKAKELETPSGDFSTKEFQAQSDGALFYKAKEGRDDMPTFKKKIPEDNDIWSIVNFMRTLGEKK